MTALLLALVFLARPESPDAAALVEMLGSGCYRCREHAEARLRAMGPLAVPALDRAATHKDMEIRMRAWRLSGGLAPCPACKGSGRCVYLADPSNYCRRCLVARDRHHEPPGRCPTCGGSGRVRLGD
jgi:hypothetical protein